MTKTAVFNQQINCSGRGLALESLGNAEFLAGTGVLTYLFQIAAASLAVVFSSPWLLGDLSTFKSRQRTSFVMIYYLHCVSCD